tara:strand:+ start:199 stop:1188 length:990 start_codon:yes stop_codon:yes gene_type:complete
MSTYESTYCNTTTDLQFVEPNISQYDGKRVLSSNFVSSGTTHLFYLYNSGDVSGQLYLDGQEMTSTTSQPSSNDEYRYTASTDLLELFQTGGSASTLNSSVVEASSDWATLKLDAVKRASDFVRSYLPFPIYPNTGVGTQGSTERDFPEIIIRATAALACESLVRPYDNEKANLIKDQVINDQGSGYLDMLRTGQIHLYQSETEYKKRGIIRIVSQNANSTGGIVDVKGTPSYSWDKIKIIISSGGTITEGVANTTVKFSSFIGNQNGLKLERMANEEVIDCYWQLVGHSMYVRFSSGVYNLNDEYELEISGVLDHRLTPIKRVQMTRK